MNISKKQIRQQRLLKELEKNPFLTDEQLALTLKVSIQTIRLDRLGKGIPELRERTRQMAENVLVQYCLEWEVQHGIISIHNSTNI